MTFVCHSYISESVADGSSLALNSCQRFPVRFDGGTRGRLLGVGLSIYQIAVARWILWLKLKLILRIGKGIK